MLLITRPYYDRATHYLFYWSEEIIKKAERVRLAVFDLQKKRAVRKTIESFLKKQNPRVVIFNGHGSDEAMTGQDDEVVISFNNAEILANKNIYMRACNAGKSLGPVIMKKGAKGFIGYREPFIFPYDIDKVRRPLEDELARPCLECSNQVAFALVSDASVEEAHNLSLDRYREKINELAVSNKPPYLIGPLVWNMHHQVCYDASSE